MMLYRRFCSGESVEELAAVFDIPEERVEQRLRAAALCEERRRTQSGLMSLQASLARS